MMDDLVVQCAANVKEILALVVGAESSDEEAVTGLRARLSTLRPGERAMVNLTMELLRGAFGPDGANGPSYQPAQPPSS